MQVSKRKQGTKRQAEKELEADPITDAGEEEAALLAAEKQAAEVKKAKVNKVIKVTKKSGKSIKDDDDVTMAPQHQEEVKKPSAPAAAEVGYSVEIGVSTTKAAEAKAFTDANASITRDPTVDESKALLVAYAARDWTEGIDANNPNIALASAYEHHCIWLINPREAFQIKIDRPGARQGDPKRKGKKPRRTYDFDTLFTNLRFRCAPREMSATLVWAVSDVMLAQLQAGNWAGAKENRGKDFMKEKFTDARKKVLLTPAFFTVQEKDEKTGEILAEYSPTKREIKDDQGNVLETLNGDFMDSLEHDQEIALMMCEAAVNEDRSLGSKYTATVEAELYGNMVKNAQSSFEQSLKPWASMLKSGKVTQAEYDTEEKNSRLEHFIGFNGKVDEAKLKASVSYKDVAKVLLDKHYTKALKSTKSGQAYVAFETKIVRNSSKMEKDNRPTFSDPIEEAIYVGSNGDKMYNQHSYINLADWNKENAVGVGAVLTDEERQVQGISSFKRMLDSSSKAGLVYKLRFFWESPVGKIGFAREFEGILFYAPPSAEEINKFANGRQESSLMQAPKKVIKVPGAKKFTFTELTREMDESDPAEIQAQLAKYMKDLEQKIKDKKAGGGGGSGPTKA